MTPTKTLSTANVLQIFKCRWVHRAAKFRCDRSNRCVDRINN